MALPAHRRKVNIRLSLQSVVGDSLAIASVNPAGAAIALTVPVYHSSPFEDPDQVRDPSTASARAWVETRWLQERAGSNGKSVWQIDVYSAIGAPGDTDGDPFGVVADDIGDAVENLFSGPRSVADTRLKAWVPIYNYANPLAPVQTDVCALISPNGTGIGRFGTPASRTPARREGRYSRVTITYELTLNTDQAWLDLRYGT